MKKAPTNSHARPVGTQRRNKDNEKKSNKQQATNSKQQTANFGIRILSHWKKRTTNTTTTTNLQYDQRTMEIGVTPIVNATISSMSSSRDSDYYYGWDKVDFAKQQQEQSYGSTSTTSSSTFKRGTTSLSSHSKKNTEYEVPDLVIECGDVVVDLSNLVPRIPCKPKAPLGSSSSVLKQISVNNRKMTLKKRKSYRHLYPSKSQAGEIAELVGSEIMKKCKIVRPVAPPTAKKIKMLGSGSTNGNNGNGNGNGNRNTGPGAYNCHPSSSHQQPKAHKATSHTTKQGGDQFSNHMEEHMHWAESYFQQGRGGAGGGGYSSSSSQQQQQQQSPRANHLRHDRPDYHSEYSSVETPCASENQYYSSTTPSSISSNSEYYSHHREAPPSPRYHHQQQQHGHGHCNRHDQRHGHRHDQRHNNNNHHDYHNTHNKNNHNGDLQVEISPGVFAPLRGSEETWNAIEDGFSINVDCFICSISLICIADADYVLCPECRVVGPTQAEERKLPSSSAFYQEHRGGVGLGLQARPIHRAASITHY